jgi:hypothetical protein
MASAAGAVLLTADALVVSGQPLLQGGTLQVAWPTTSTTLTGAPLNLYTGGTAAVPIIAGTTSGNSGGTSITVNGGILRFNPSSQPVTVGTGVTGTITSGTTLELAGTTSNLSNAGTGSNRVVVLNQQPSVGTTGGAGTLTNNAGSELTANHIVQGALIINGDQRPPPLVTIPSSDWSGNPLSSAGSLTPAQPL